MSNFAYPIVIMSFNRPHYLEAVLRSLQAQTCPINSDEVILFQDGYRGRDGKDATDPRLVDHCIHLFETLFPRGKILVSANNLGTALNFARAESHIFEELGADAGYFFEDDMVLSPHYLIALGALTKIALTDTRIAYVAAYGNHRASLAEQRRARRKLIPMRHKWGFALTHRQWAAQRTLLEPYLDIVARNEYMARDHGAIKNYFRQLGYASGTSQDGMKDVASCILGTAKIMTYICFAKYIGEAGLHSTKHMYDDEGYGQTDIYPDEVLAFDMPSSDELDDWIAAARMRGKKVLESLASTR